MFRVLFPGHFDVRRPSYTCYHLCRSMASAEFPVEITVPSYARVNGSGMLKASLPNPAGRMLGKLNRDYLKQWTEATFLKSVAASDTVYIWGRVPPKLVSALKDRGVLIFQEKINGLNAASREILDAVYDRLGKRPTHGLTDDVIARELEQLSLVDYVFVANPVAADQYGRFGVDTRKLIRSSYGWEQNRFSGPQTDRPGRPFTVAFVGVADIHKGADLLLRVWAQSGIEGRLVFGGPVSRALAEDCADALARPDVIVTGWTDDIASIYRSADVFVFPSHDEGGPLVTYEAMGCGLPVVVSPIGAGAIARDGLDGYVIDPFDLDAWIDALRRLAADPELRRSMGSTARQRAQDFTWEKVGARRRRAIIERTCAMPSSPVAAPATACTG